jgi:hypothetical protein
LRSRDIPVATGAGAAFAGVEEGLAEVGRDDFEGGGLLTGAGFEAAGFEPFELAGSCFFTGCLPVDVLELLFWLVFLPLKRVGRFDFAICYRIIIAHKV